VTAWSGTSRLGAELARRQPMARRRPRQGHSHRVGQLDRLDPPL